MLEYYFDHNSKNKKWIWIVLLVFAVTFMVWCFYKKSIKKKKQQADTESSDYLTMDHECVACGGDETEKNSLNSPNV